MVEWNDKELKILKDMGKDASMKELQDALPNKSYYSIQGKKLKLLGGRFNKSSWSTEEDEILKANRFKLNSKIKELLPNKSISQIRLRKKKLDISYYEHRLSEKDEKYIKKNYKDFTDEEIANKLDNKVLPSYIKTFRQDNDLIKDIPSTAHKWKEEQVIFLKDNYQSKTLAQLSKLLELDKEVVRHKIRSIGLKKEKIIWTEDELKTIEENKKLNAEELQKKFFPNRSTRQIRYIKEKKGIAGKTLFSDEEIDLIKELSSEYKVKELIKKFRVKYPDRTDSSIKTKFYELDLKNIKGDFPKIIKDMYFKELNNNKELKELNFSYSQKSLNLKCLECGHVFPRQIQFLYTAYKAHPEYVECPSCANKIVNDKNNLLFKRPDIAKMIDLDRHPNVDTSKIYWRSNDIFNFVCLKNQNHRFEKKLVTIVDIKTEVCPFCRKQWTPLYLKLFLKSIIPLLPNMSQGDRWVFFQMSGILDSTKRNVAFAKQVITQKFPVKEIENYVEDKPSLVTDILDDPTITSTDYTDTKTDIEIQQEVEEIIQKFDDVIEQTEENLPEIKSKDVLKSLDKITSSQFCDKEAIEFLIVSKKEKLWRDIFERGKIAVNEIRKASGNEYVKRAKNEFLFEYDHTSKLKPPSNFTAKTNDGSLIKPNLMQFLTTTRLNYNSRIGNWSGTGAGKTLSAILASRLLNLKFTIVTCPNSVVSNWENNIRNAFQDSEVLDKRNLPKKINPKKHNYLVLNYEYFQQPTSSKYVKKLLSLGKIAFIVIDEVHYTKQREIDNVSKRKEMIKNLVVEAGIKNKQLKVIGMSATPVINNLYEGRSMIELITGKEHKDIETKVNVNNCMYLFQKLSTIGTRYLPKYEVNIDIKPPIEIDCSEVIDEIKEKGSRNIKILELELILTRIRIPEIIKNLEKKTIIYTHYIKGIGEILAEAISKAGYTVGFYTGEDKSGFDSFVKGNTDILIGTSAIGTGVDGLQNVCRKLIFNVLPWTNAEYEQIKGRIYRQGQKRDVEFIIPVTRAEVNGQEWSWCKTKLDRINYKKTVADASVDGIIPEEHIRTEHQVLQDLMKWLDRLSDNGVETFERKELVSTLFTDDEKELQRRKRNHGDFTKINKRWNTSRSGITHKRLQKDSYEWVHYHEEYRKAREDWTVTPYKEMIKFYKKRDGLIIGDFGCGEAFLHKELSSKHTIHSFDHVAMEKFVTECDFSKTPLDDESLDVAIYSLAMMGSNINEYLHEAHRVLRLDGKINIIEATSRFKDIEQFKVQLQEFGFDNVVSKGMWKFTHIIAEKSDRKVNEKAKINF